jgi:DNA-binding NtrC family response regulator
MAFYAEPIPEWPLCRRPLILLVEDEVLIRSAVAEYLRADAMDVIEAASAEEAVAVIAAAAPIDLVFTDVTMPGRIDGLGFSYWLARHHTEIAVLVTSGQPLPVALATEENRCFIAKPYRMSDVARLLRRLLQRQGE